MLSLPTRGGVVKGSIVVEVGVEINLRQTGNGRLSLRIDRDQQAGILVPGVIEIGLSGKVDHIRSSSERHTRGRSPRSRFHGRRGDGLERIGGDGRGRILGIQSPGNCEHRCRGQQSRGNQR
jgi:hypothetical protein